MPVACCLADAQRIVSAELGAELPAIAALLDGAFSEGPAATATATATVDGEAVRRVHAYLLGTAV